LIDASHKESLLEIRANVLSATSRPMNRKDAKGAKIFHSQLPRPSLLSCG